MTAILPLKSRNRRARISGHPANIEHSHPRAMAPRRPLVRGSSACAEHNTPDGRHVDMTTLLLAEHDNKALKDATSKALTAAKALGQPVHVLGAGKNCRAGADAAATVDGVSRVLL